MTLALARGKVWPGSDEEVIFEQGLENALLMLTQSGRPLPGRTYHLAGRKRGGRVKAAVPSGIVF